MTPVGLLGAANKLTIRSGVEAAGKVVASDLFGWGVYEASGIVTDNETLRMLAAMGASFVSSATMEYYDAYSRMRMNAQNGSTSTSTNQYCLTGEEHFEAYARI